MTWIYFMNFIFIRFLNILKISRIMLIFLFDIRKSCMNLITSSMNMIRYLFSSNEIICIDSYISKWINALFFECLLLMKEKSDLYIFFITHSMHIFIFLVSCFEFPRIFNFLTFSLIMNIIMIELVVWSYLLCYMHNFISHFNITIWIMILYWSIKMKHNSSMIFISI